jgi:hypothetical protein
MQMLGLILLIFFGGMAIIAMFSAIHLLLPVMVENTRVKLEGSIGNAFLLGLVNLVFFGVTAIVLSWLAGLIRDNWSGPAAFLAVFLGLVVLVILLALAAFILDGLVALVTLLGTRIGPARTPFMSDLRGGLLLVLACLSPYVGWFVFTPAVVCISLGSAILALFQKKVKILPE